VPARNLHQHIQNLLQTDPGEQHNIYIVVVLGAGQEPAPEHPETATEYRQTLGNSITSILLLY
jgi:hypothetical protein